MPQTPSPAAEIAAALGVARRGRLPPLSAAGQEARSLLGHSDLDGAPDARLFVRLHGPGLPGKWCDAATGEHGDLLDLIRRQSAAPTLRAAMDEARVFLALPAPPALGESGTYDATEAARRLWRRCRASTASRPRPISARGGSRGTVSPPCASTRALFHREADRCLPALVAAVTDPDGALHGVHRTWLDPATQAKADVLPSRKALGRVFGRAVRLGAPGSTLLVGEGIETVLSLVSAAPRVPAAAALSAGSLGAFVPPEGVSRLIIAGTTTRRVRGLRNA